MSDIVLLDTSVYLNVLDVPGFNQDRGNILDEFVVRVEQGDYFLLPMATIWETGDHIADLADGRLRRQFAQSLVEQVTQAFNNKAPFRTTYFPDSEVFLRWLGDFLAMRNAISQTVKLVKASASVTSPSSKNGSKLATAMPCRVC